MGYGWKLRSPAALQRKDFRTWVGIDADELPAPLRFNFVRLQDTTTGEVSVEYLSHEIESEALSWETVAGADLEGIGMTPDQSRWVKDNLLSYSGHGGMSHGGRPRRRTTHLHVDHPAWDPEAQAGEDADARRDRDDRRHR